MKKMFAGLRAKALMLCAVLMAASALMMAPQPAEATVGLGTTLRNAMLDQIETTIGTSPVLRMYSGSIPANCGTAASGTLLAEMTLPSDWMAAASGGTKAKSGTWQDASANATGTLGYFRILDSTGTTCHLQGTITATGGGGDMTVDNTSAATGQPVTVNTFTLTAPNP